MLWAISWCLLVAICTFYGNLDQVVVHPDRLWRQAFYSIHRDWSGNLTQYYTDFVLQNEPCGGQVPDEQQSDEPVESPLGNAWKFTHMDESVEISISDDFLPLTEPNLISRTDFFCGVKVPTNSPLSYNYHEVSAWPDPETDECHPGFKACSEQTQPAFTTCIPEILLNSEACPINDLRFVTEIEPLFKQVVY